MKIVSPEIRLARVLVALEPELTSATDGEIREAAADLGMKLDMQGSVAFTGLKSPAKARFEDWFGPDAVARVRKLMEARKRALGRLDDDENK